jgi:hypothetical protein
MHCHAERQYQAPLGVARVRTAAGTRAVPTAVASWSFITPNFGMAIDSKPTRPRPPVTSP